MFREQRTDFGDSLLEITEFVDLHMRVGVFNDGRVTPEFVSVEVADSTNLWFDEIEKNLNVCAARIVLRNAFPQIFVNSFDVSLFLLVVCHRLDSNDLIGQKIREKLNDVLRVSPFQRKEKLCRRISFSIRNNLSDFLPIKISRSLGIR